MSDPRFREQAIQNYVAATGHGEVFVRAALKQLEVPHTIAFTINAEAARLEAEDKLRALDRLINTPQVDNFLEAVRTEAAHQQLRWGTDQETGKEDSDWFWLIGYLAGKGIRPGNTQEKRLHHIITAAAACFNWHRHATGEVTDMRPGIEPLEATQALKEGE